MKNMAARIMLQQVNKAMAGLMEVANEKEHWDDDERALLCRSINGLACVVSALVERVDADLKCKSGANLPTVQ